MTARKKDKTPRRTDAVDAMKHERHSELRLLCLTSLLCNTTTMNPGGTPVVAKRQNCGEGLAKVVRACQGTAWAGLCLIHHHSWAVTQPLWQTRPPSKTCAVREWPGKAERIAQNLLDRRIDAGILRTFGVTNFACVSFQARKKRQKPVKPVCLLLRGSRRCDRTEARWPIYYYRERPSTRPKRRAPSRSLSPT